MQQIYNSLDDDLEVPDSLQAQYDRLTINDMLEFLNTNMVRLSVVMESYQNSTRLFLSTYHSVSQIMLVHISKYMPVFKELGLTLTSVDQTFGRLARPIDLSAQPYLLARLAV